MEKLIKGLLLVSLMVGLNNAYAIELGVSTGIVGKVNVAGAYVKKGKYTIDGHMGMNDKDSAVSLGIYRELVDISQLGLKVGVGLSTNKTEMLENNLKVKRVYQGYDLELNYDVKKFKLRTTINSNGDIKAGIGFSF